MKKIIYIFITAFLFSSFSHSQINKYNLSYKNLNKKVRKTIQHYYTYDKKSGGFVKKSVSIDTYNNDGFLTETYYLYNSSYSSGSPTKKVYHYNSDNQITWIENISAKKTEYTTDVKFTYNRKGHLTKKESIYENGDKSFVNYQNDNKGRIVKIENYNKKQVLSSETQITYRGSKRTEVNTTYSTKDGSINGTYTSVFKNDIKIDYVSESKWSNSRSSYKYDKNDNLIESISKGKKTYTYLYNYDYDGKGNWVKKHYKSKSYDSFYFREIIYKNDKITGSTSFDRNFINKHANYDNVAVVPLKKKEYTPTTKKKTNNYMPSFRYKEWTYSFINMNKKVSSLSGTVKLDVTDNSQMSIGSNIKLRIKIDGNNETSGSYKVIDYISQSDQHKWTIKSVTKNVNSTLYIFKEKKRVKGMSIDGLLLMGSGEKQITFYLM
ncbi:MAG: hypothetical protein JXQ93_03020 [Flavobacteriaceae bacterium]